MTASRRHVAWLGLGSNLDEPMSQVRSAVHEITTSNWATLLALSSFYRTTPVGGPPDQPEYCNAAAAVATGLPPCDLLAALHGIEADHHRVRDVRWGPRTLDLDIIAYDNACCLSPELTLPHPRAHERGFVLVPLAEIAPALELGVHGRVVDCLRLVSRQGIRHWESAP